MFNIKLIVCHEVQTRQYKVHSFLHINQEVKAIIMGAKEMKLKR
jgi:hypothetical protein